MVDGHKQTGTVDGGGTLAIDPGGSIACVGYPIASVIDTQELEIPSRETTVSQSRMKRVNQIWVRLLQSLGGTAGTESTNQESLVFRTESMAMDDSPDLKDGYVPLSVNAGFDRELTVRLEHDEPFPFHITGIVAEVSKS